MWDECNCAVVWLFFGIAFLRDWNENWPFPILWPLLSFPNLLAYWVQHFHSIIFQDLKFLNWNSTTSTSFFCSDAFWGPPDFIFQVSGSRWVITPSWLSGSWFGTVLLCTLATSSNIFCFCRAMSFLFFIVPIFAWNVPLIPLIFLKRSLIFPILFFPSISVHYSLRKSFLSLLALLWDSTFKWVYLSFPPLPFMSFLFSAICKASSDNYFSFLHFFFLGMVLITASCTMSCTSIHSSSGTLSDLIPWIYFSLPPYSHKGFDLGHNWMV